MAEVPPGPNTLPASSAEIISLPVDGCSFLGNNEKLDRGRGDVLAPGTEAQQATEPKGIVKLSQNSVHHLHSPAQLHSSRAQLNGIASHPEHDEHRGHKIAPNHVAHRAHRAADCQRTASVHVDSIDGRGSRKSACNNRDSSLPSNGVDFPDPAAITELGSSDQLERERPCLKAELGRTVCRSECTDNVQKAAGDRERGLGPQGSGAEEALLEDQIAKLSVSTQAVDHSPITYVRYESELQMPDIIRLITKDLSEPYSIYTYRYFIHNWPQLCFLAMVEKNCVGAIVCKLDMHKKMFRRGYIAMLAVDSKFRRKGIGTNLVKKAIYAMVEGDCDEVVLETEITNKSALKLYENLGFVRDKRLFRYYLNGVDALRLKLWLR
ncbi:hypothetical protein AMELA_G00124240 [Ameiurus melas]|uniref:N-alpha-acetyltransferase 30 n=1 Tax=Ameiurus melas TaxID=219545 RepID=A0A7J6ANC1_AMEME|nr:hypothetical protein AMELA_G00124240 [Ameiurus melas]